MKKVYVRALQELPEFDMEGILASVTDRNQSDETDAYYAEASGNEEEMSTDNGLVSRDEEWKEACHMLQTISVTDLRKNIKEISELCHTTCNPLVITKNGYSDLVVMSVEAYREMLKSEKEAL